MPEDLKLAPPSPKIQTPTTPSTPFTPFTPTRRNHGCANDAQDITGPTGSDVLLFLIGSRLLNALIIQTFFQPDEYFQALEPAWDLAFGAGSGAWITWVGALHKEKTQC